MKPKEADSDTRVVTGSAQQDREALELVRLTPQFAPACARLEAVLFDGDDPWPQAAFVQELANPSNFYVGIISSGVQDSSKTEVSDGLLGYGGISKMGPDGDAEYEIHTIGVAPEQQGKGISRLIMDALVEVASEDPGPIYLEVRTDNEPAISLYISYGFEHMGLRKRYYQQSGADAYTMCRTKAQGVR